MSASSSSGNVSSRAIYLSSACAMLMADAGSVGYSLGRFKVTFIGEPLYEFNGCSKLSKLPLREFKTEFG